MPASAPAPVSETQEQQNIRRWESNHIAALAHQLAHDQPAAVHHPGKKPSLIDQLNGYEKALQKAYEHFSSAAAQDLTISHSGEWLLDNNYIVNQAIRLIREDMPKGFYKRLPKLGAGPYEGYPRVFHLANTLVLDRRTPFETDEIQRFIASYQEIHPLTIGELWALPVMLRLVVLGELIQILARITGIVFQLPLFLVSTQTKTLGIRDDTIVANCILNLRSLATLDWKDFVENVSVIEKILSQDPVGVYVHMDFDTRDQYRRVVEELALLTKQEEAQVASEAIALASSALPDTSPTPPKHPPSPSQPTLPEWSSQHQMLDAPDGASAHFEFPASQHVGYYLIDAGRPLLESRLGYRPNPFRRVHRWMGILPIVPYLGSVGVLTFVTLIGVVHLALPTHPTFLMKLLAGLIMFVPALTVSVNLVHWIITLIVPAKRLPKMDFSKGIPPAYRTMVVVPTLLCTLDEINSLLAQLELHYLSNQDPSVTFALLTDFKDAPLEEMPGESELLEKVKVGIDTLNNRYNLEGEGLFSLFHRQRVWNPHEECWMGWERKRGKLIEFNQLIRGSQSTNYHEIVSPPLDLDRIYSIVTLDADTLLPEGTVPRLVGTLAHPLNQPHFDARSGAVISGYTVLQPRVEIKPTSANQNLFTRIFSGDIALDLYSRAISDVYQDAFGEGIFVGKGIYHVDAFQRSLEGRVPDNCLLSHDLFEGIHGRAGLVSDITLFEEFPPHYLAFAQRLHRWLRGDWQLLPWLLPWAPYANGTKKTNRLSLLSRWKIFDNLKRSLLMPSLLLMLILGWLFLPNKPWIVSLIVPFMLAVPWLTSLGNQIDHFLTGFIRGRRIYLSLHSDFRRWVLSLVFLPFETLLALDAITATIFRLWITRKHLLQWTTSSEAVRKLGKRMNVAITLKEMAPALLLTLFIGISLGLLRLDGLLSALPLLTLWLIAPLIAYAISRSTAAKSYSLSTMEEACLRRIARRTWLFFEEFVGPEDHWLPPDHFQEDPLGLVAHRTSPTNIGLMLLSNLAAYKLGYIGATSLAFRLHTTLENLGLLERYHGHLLNWYDTRTLQPLAPRYVSTVDSGNLAACLLTLKQACLELPYQSILRWERWQGLLDALSLLSEALEKLVLIDPGRTRDPIVRILNKVQDRIIRIRHHKELWISLWSELSREGWKELSSALQTLLQVEGDHLEATDLANLRICNDLVHVHLFRAQREIELLLPWLSALAQTPTVFTRKDLDPTLIDAWCELNHVLILSPRLIDLPHITLSGEAQLERIITRLNLDQNPSEELDVAREWCLWLAASLKDARLEAEVLLKSFFELTEQLEREVQSTDFRFLFNERRQVFHLGYHVDTGRLDANYYDLLASEARLASIIAMAKRDAPQNHWLHLGRPLTQIDGSRVLLSWGGTMFEYLMPSLLVRNYEGTLLNQSAYTAVERQISYGRQNNIPWGISESGYYAFDANLSYQYRAFGVPNLGLKRGLAEDLVVTPYASILSIPFRPQEVIRNIQLLQRMNMQGKYGFYEAIDFTPTRLPLGNKNVTVYSYMAHHQGMILLTLANFLLNKDIVRLFHSDPRIKGVELLLQERIPQEAPIESLRHAEVNATQPTRLTGTLAPWSVPIRDVFPRTHLLSNGRYNVILTSSGGGFSRWETFDLTRWRADTTLENWGTWIYIQDLESKELWSAGYLPTGTKPQNHSVLFEAHKAEFWRQDGAISTRMEVTVAPDDDAEIRLVTLTNHGSERCRLMLTSYAEPVLAAQTEDRRHPSFNKLFIESEFLPAYNALLFRRRPRSSKEPCIYMAHMLISATDQASHVSYEAERYRFIGRGRTPRSPACLTIDPSGLSNTDGATLDPIMSLSQQIDLEPSATEQIAWITLAASQRDELFALIERYQSWSIMHRTFERARSQTELELRRLGYTGSELMYIGRLLGALLYPHKAFRADPARLSINRKGQSALWPYNISGDFPILLVCIGNQEETSLVREVLRAYDYWRKRGIKVDLVFLNEHDTGYSQDLNNQLFRMVNRMDGDAWMNRRGGIFLLRADQMSDADRIMLESAARVILYGHAGSLGEQLERCKAPSSRLPYLVPSLPRTTDHEPSERPCRPEGLLFDNIYGGFSSDGREYVIYHQPNKFTPAPWINVVANQVFGFLVSESGLGCTWSDNSGENRLTPWSNDPVSDSPSEAIYLRDEETGAVWTPTPLPAGEHLPYLIRHGAGYSIFEHHSHNLDQRLCLFAAPDAPIKIVQLSLRNTAQRTRRITATYFAEWVLGNDRDQNQAYVVPEFNSPTQAVLVRNPYNAEFGERVAFLAGSKAIHGLTTDRTEFLGRMGSYDHPAALDLVGLSGTVQAGLDPCAAIMLHLDLPPGEEEEIFFLLGEERDYASSLSLIERYKNPKHVQSAWEAVHTKWEDLLGAIQVKTPEPAMDLLLNRWLLYQSLSCRFWGRTAFYQSSGAYGFRDQLQDSMAFLFTAPQLCRQHLLEAARHQFEEGDVLHWWHPPSGRGVRTRISDDLLWLPYCVAQYILTTGDNEILYERLPFLSGAPLEPEEMERFGLYATTDQNHSLYDHCLRALDRASATGRHGLPLIGSGDWNDGLNQVGSAGKGESVWLGWFLYATLTCFVPLCTSMKDDQKAETLLQQAEELRLALEESAWDGDWYLRGFHDDGSTLGSSRDSECQISAIAQSWAVLSHAADAERCERAMDSLLERLVRYEDRMILLLTPPFDRTPRDPGYIKGYPPGIRENGGQYTHGVQWAIWALAELGRGEEAEALYRMLNPIFHGQNPDKYHVEPYVVAADIYSAPAHLGRGGWTWYTGSAAWMYRLGIERILGINKIGNKLKLDPRIPSRWDGFKVTYRWCQSSYELNVENPEGASQGVREVFLDGRLLLDGIIPLQDDGRDHEVHVLMGKSQAILTQADTSLYSTRGISAD